MVFLVKLKTIFHLSQPQYTLALVYYKMQVVLNLRAQSKSDKKILTFIRSSRSSAECFEMLLEFDYSTFKKSWMLKRVYSQSQLPIYTSLFGIDLQMHNQLYFM